MAANQLVAVPIGLHAGDNQRRLAQATELVHFGVRAGRIALVDDEQFGLVDPPQAFGHFQVQGNDAALRVDHEQQQVGLLDGDADLVLDLLGEVVDVLDPQPARVDQLEIPIVFVEQILDAVARHAGRRIDDGDQSAGQPVEERALPDVRTTDDGNFGDGHGSAAVSSVGQMDDRSNVA